MSAFKGTPGPWTVDPSDEDCAIWCINADVGSVCTIDSPDDLAAANAALIAAAPAMLEALVEFDEWMSDESDDEANGAQDIVAQHLLQVRAILAALREGGAL